MGLRSCRFGWIITAFVVGAAVFWGLETLLARSTSSISQLIAMLSDFIREVCVVIPPRRASFAERDLGGVDFTASCRQSSNVAFTF
ncbi:MAG: hypothetical protein WBD31_10780 [Rubripirellula sp.]